MTARLNLLVIRSKDMEAAVRFYEHLGVTFVRHAHGSGPEHYASESADVVFEIYPLRPDESPTASTRLGVQVDSVDETLPRLRSAGGRLLSSPKASRWGRRAVVEDFDGHRVELTSKQNNSA
jgi:predicted enzyme related to lactoylglutathione lyase